MHYPSDVLAGWTLGVLWLVASVAASRMWLLPERGHAPLLLPAPGALATTAAPARGRPLPDGWHTAAALAVAAVLLWGLMLLLGIVVTDLVPAVQQFDLTVVRWMATVRTDQLSDLAVAAGRAGGTARIVAVLVISVPVALAATRRWAPPLFLLVVTVGETAIFLAVASVVERSRPPVDHLSEQLPPTASFPSGHVAAAVLTYGGIALLVVAWSRNSLRYLAPVAAVLLVVAVALSRLYRGVHYPTDVGGSLLYGTVWLAVCWWLLRPGRGSARAGVDA